MRRTLAEARKSLLAANLGFCTGDIVSIATVINQAQEELIYAMGETGAWGGWFRTVFNVNPYDPYITCPREIARITDAAVCTSPVRVRNQWFEFMDAQGGPRPLNCGCEGTLQLIDRGMFPTAYDMPSTGYLRVYKTDDKDRAKRVLIDGLDQNGYRIQGVDSTATVQGVYLSLIDPFATTPMMLSEIKGVTKDETYGDVILVHVDESLGTETFLARYGPQELVPSLRRYYVENLPCGCGNNTDPALVPTTQVTCLAKLEFIPAWRDTDFLIIGNIPALIEKCRAIRHGNMDSKEMKELSFVEHRRAVRMLNDELRHYLGSNSPEVRVYTQGTASLARARIGGLV